jgi:hypothetical protein
VCTYILFYLLRYQNVFPLSRDMSTMVELTSFSTLGKIQPFLVTITTTAALLVDLHCHLTDKEICGYLGGHWDINSHSTFHNYCI